MSIYPLPKFSQYFCQHCAPDPGPNAIVSVYMDVDRGELGHIYNKTSCEVRYMNETVEYYIQYYRDRNIKFTAILKCQYHIDLFSNLFHSIYQALIDCNHCKNQIIYYDGR
jgi:hypothetical protein